MSLQGDAEPVILVLQDKLNTQGNLELTSSLLKELGFFTCHADPTHIAMHLSSGLWASIAVPGHVIRLGSQRAVFLKDLAVKQCPQLDDLKRALLQKPTPHLFNDLQQQRQEIKHKIDVSIVAAAPPPSQKKRDISHSPPTVLAPKRQRYVSPTDSFGTRFTASPSPADDPLIVSTTIDLTSDDDGSSSYVPLSSESSGTRHESPVLISSDDDEQPRNRKWPYGYYVIDVVGCIQAIIDNPTRRTNAEIFREHFPLEQKYNSSTYHDNKNRWLAAPEEAKQKALDAGRTPGGLWQVFSKANPLVHAAKKAAKKRSGH